MTLYRSPHAFTSTTLGDTIPLFLIALLTMISLRLAAMRLR